MKEDYSKTNLIFSLAAFFIGYLYFIIRGINYFSLMIYEHTGKSLLYFRGAFFNEIFEREHSFIYDFIIADYPARRSYFIYYLPICVFV